MAPSNVQGFKSSAVFQQIHNGVQTPSGKEAAKKVNFNKVNVKVNAVFQFDVKNSSGQVQSWTLDFKSSDSSEFVKSAKASKADITIAVSDDDFVDLAAGKLNGQKAFMAGKIKGNMMLATKLDAVLKQASSATPSTSAQSNPKSSSDHVRVAGFKVSEPFAQLKAGVENGSDSERQATVKKVNAIFQFDLKNSSGKVQSWTLDLKTGKGSMNVGAAEGKKADIILTASDDDFFDLVSGKTTGQKAFMAGKLKVKGNVMLATKLDGVLKQAKAKL